MGWFYQIFVCSESFMIWLSDGGMRTYWSWMGRKWLIWQTGLYSTWSPDLQDQHHNRRIPTYYIVSSNQHYLRQYRPAPFIVGFDAHLQAKNINKSLLRLPCLHGEHNLPCIWSPAGVHWDYSWQDYPGSGQLSSLNLEEEPTQRRRRRLYHPIWNFLEGFPSRKMTRF